MNFQSFLTIFDQKQTPLHLVRALIMTTPSTAIAFFNISVSTVLEWEWYSQVAMKFQLKLPCVTLIPQKNLVLPRPEGEPTILQFTNKIE